MRTWLKRLLLTVATLLVVAVLCAALGWSMFRGTPDWYDAARADAGAPTSQQAADRAEQTVKDALVWASESQAAQTRARRAAERGGATAAPATAPSTTNPHAKTITFTEPELNAFLAKWSVLPAWQREYGRHVADPVVLLRDGRLILAGKVSDVRAIVSLHLQPALDDAGKLRLKIARILGGKLPLPRSFLDKPTASLTDTVRVKLPGHQRDAALGPDGAANDAAVAAAMLKLLAAVLHDVPAEPVLFFPNTNGESNVPVKLTGVNVADKKLAITIEPMTPEEQAELLKHIREPQEEVATVRE